MGFYTGTGWLSGSTNFVIDSGTLGCSVGIGLLAQAGLRISTPSKILLAFLGLKISCSSAAMHWSAVNTLVDNVETMLVATLVWLNVATGS
jgi:hypothetical protein